MKKLLALCAAGVLLAGSGVVLAAPAIDSLFIDLTPAPAPVITGHLGMGTSRSPDGQTLDADSRTLYLNGKPWVPVSGEFHYARYPSEEWRDQLLKMKAGGLDVVAAYVFWIHHEEHPDEWDWSGQRSLREFIRVSREVGLKVIVRLGPWAHGEARNGGFPDWVQARDRSQRRNQDPGFMALTEKLYRQIAQQLDGQLWKDGGPVIGVQLDNECPDLPYLFALKELAQKCGLDVPLYTMTGWNNVPIPEAGLLPLFGGYADGFWVDKKDKFRTYYFFTPERNVGDMGAIGPVKKEKQLDLARRLARYPYACCEIGGGMQSSYDRRLVVGGADCSALALVKIGCGNNMPGYYMYQGGINPDGKYTGMNQCKAVGEPNDMPVKDYDFNAPLGACGELRAHYHLLREQHLFLKDWGADIALMPPFFPTNRPTLLSDTEKVRWSVRSDGARAFLFFNNYQRFGQLPPKTNVQFSLKLNDGVQLVPQSPVTIPSGAYGMWPVNLDCAGVPLAYATAQPICRLDETNEHWFFFTAIEGIATEFMFGGTSKPGLIKKIKPGANVAFTRTAADKSKVHFVVLTPSQAKQLWKVPLVGRDRVLLSPNAILPDGNSRIRLETIGAEAPALTVFPPVKAVKLSGTSVVTAKDGVFQRFDFKAKLSPPASIGCDVLKAPDTSSGQPLDAVQEESWKSAGVWRLQIPPAVSAQTNLLRIAYIGDAARVLVDGKLVLDNYSNGQPFNLALWRIPAGQQGQIEIHILPPRSDRPNVLLAEAFPHQPLTEATLVSVTALPRIEWGVECE